MEKNHNQEGIEPITVTHKEYALIMESLGDSILTAKEKVDYNKVQTLQQLQDKLGEGYKLEIKPVEEQKEETKSSSIIPEYSKCGEVCEE